MSTAKQPVAQSHTPGPWRWDKRGQFLIDADTPDDGDFHEGAIIALLGNGRPTPVNAALIASAPDLKAENERLTTELERRIAERTDEVASWHREQEKRDASIERLREALAQVLELAKSWLRIEASLNKSKPTDGSVERIIAEAEAALAGKGEK